MKENDYDEVKKDRNLAIGVCIFFIALWILFLFLYSGEVEQQRTIDKCGSSDYKLRPIHTGNWLTEEFVGYSCCKEIEGEYIFDETTGEMNKEKSKDCFFTSKDKN